MRIVNISSIRGIVAGDRWERPDAPRLVRDIEIADNTFKDGRSDSITLRSCENVVVRNCRATGAIDYSPARTKKGVKIQDSTRVTLEDVVCVDGRSTAACGVEIGKNCGDGDEIASRNLTVELPAEAVDIVDRRSPPEPAPRRSSRSLAQSHAGPLSLQSMHPAK